MQYLRKQLGQLLIRWKRQEEAETDVPEEEEGNPYLPRLREIIEFILKRRKIPYEQFAPMLIDGGDVQNTLLAAELLSRDLNRLVILTDRPAYFTGFTDNMYEEYGLLVEVFPKALQKIAELCADGTDINLILDLEEQEERKDEICFGRKIYIPAFKKRWESAGNLDIAVPIGYNTMIVRVSEAIKEQPYLDKFEKAFYENE